MWSRRKPTSHLRQYVDAKLSWESVEQNLRFQPKTTWHLPVDLAQKRAFRDAMLLLASQLYDEICEDRSTSGQLRHVGPEVVMVECTLLAAAAMVAYLNPEEETAELVDEVRASLASEMESMTLLADEELREISEGRIELYGVKTDKVDGYLSLAFSRVMTCLVAGDPPSMISIRYEDPPRMEFALLAERFLASLHSRLRRMLKLIIEREMADED